MAKKSFAGALNETLSKRAQDSPQEAHTDSSASEPKPSIEFKKWTVPIRTDQLADLSRAVARVQLDHDVDLSKAVLVRYGLAYVLERIRTDPTTLLTELAEFEAEEIALNGDRRYSISAGLEQYRNRAIKK